jgi:hypothetical protein
MRLYGTLASSGAQLSQTTALDHLPWRSGGKPDSAGVALFSVTGRMPRNRFRLKRIETENVLKFSDFGLRSVRVADRVRSH